MLLNRPLNPKHLSKHKILKHFIETANQNCVSNYYNDPYFRHIPSAVLLEYIKQLEEEGYLRAISDGYRLLSMSYFINADGPALYMLAKYPSVITLKQITADLHVFRRIRSTAEFFSIGLPYYSRCIKTKIFYIWDENFDFIHNIL